MAIYTIIGSRGLIGTELAKRLGDYSTTPSTDTKYLFYLGGCVHPEFERNPDYWEQKTLNDFHYLLNYCTEHDIKFIYASSALVYEKDTRFAQHKRELERIAQESPNALGLRIFPVFGKGDHNTFITQAVRDMKNNKRPSVFGDGTQSRDFTHVSEVVHQIMRALNNTGIIDVGGGVLTSFNDIINIINNELHTDLQAYYVEAPKDYSAGIKANNQFLVVKSVQEHIKELCQ